MTDQELLEKAAKAAGLQIEWHSEMAGSFPVYKNATGSGYIPWNPLRNDGDATRLAVGLGISIEQAADAVRAFTAGHTVAVFEPCYGMMSGPATRRAIVRAAAGCSI